MRPSVLDVQKRLGLEEGDRGAKPIPAPNNKINHDDCAALGCANDRRTKKVNGGYTVRSRFCSKHARLRYVRKDMFEEKVR